MPESPKTHLAREAALLDRLEERSRACPGLFPVSARLHWRNLARMALGLEPGGAPPTGEEAARIWPMLEEFDRRPEQASALLTRLLAEKKNPPMLTVAAVSADPKVAARDREAAIEALLENPQSASLSTPLPLTNNLQ